MALAAEQGAGPIQIKVIIQHKRGGNQASPILGHLTVTQAGIDPLCNRAPIARPGKPVRCAPVFQGLFRRLTRCQQRI
jgi:hypothetical protein